jgi:hypothetical protein
MLEYSAPWLQVPSLSTGAWCPAGFSESGIAMRQVFGGVVNIWVPSWIIIIVIIIIMRQVFGGVVNIWGRK